LSTEASTTNAGPRLRRTLTLRDLILYGIIVIQPVAPMSVFGCSVSAAGATLSPRFLSPWWRCCSPASATAEWRARYPSAGSAFTYVAQEVNPAVGYITGWSMVMDYMLNPLICTIWCAEQTHRFAPGIPLWGWKVFFRHRVHPSEYSGNQDLGAHQYHHGHPYGRGCRGHFRGRGTLHPRPSARRARLFHAGPSTIRVRLLMAGSLDAPPSRC